MKSKKCLTRPDASVAEGGKGRWDKFCEVAQECTRTMESCPKSTSREQRKREVNRQAKRERPSGQSLF